MDNENSTNTAEEGEGRDIYKERKESGNKERKEWVSACMPVLYA